MTFAGSAVANATLGRRLGSWLGVRSKDYADEIDLAGLMRRIRAAEAMGVAEEVRQP